MVGSNINAMDTAAQGLNPRFPTLMTTRSFSGRGSDCWVYSEGMMKEIL